VRRDLTAPRWFGVASIVVGALGFVSPGLLALRTPVPDGIFERGAVYSVFVWSAFAGLVLLGARRRRPPAGRGPAARPTPAANTIPAAKPMEQR
jgi:hypothetical protein